MQTYGQHILLASTSKDATFASVTFNIQYYKVFAIQLNITAAASLDVELKLQGSLDGVNWADDTDFSAAAVTADRVVLFDNEAAGYPFTRVLATFTTGSATFEILGFAKQ